MGIFDKVFGKDGTAAATAKRQATLVNELEEKYRGFSDSELQDVLRHGDQYTEAALGAARQEAARRFAAAAEGPPAPSAGKPPAAGSRWTPANPRYASRLPLEELERVIVFTSGPGKRVLDSLVVAGVMQDTAGAPLVDFFNRIALDVIARSSVPGVVMSSGAFPEEGWKAIERVRLELALTADAYRICTRAFDDPMLGTKFTIVFFYRN